MRVTGKLRLRYFPRFTTILLVTGNDESVTGNPRKYLRSPTLTIHGTMKNEPCDNVPEPDAFTHTAAARGQQLLDRSTPKPPLPYRK